jgi:hypothetical protein
MSTAKLKDLAEFARKAIRFGLLEVTVVRDWGDLIIEAESHPPFWAIELACSTYGTVDFLLSEVPGIARDGVAITMFCARLRKHWRTGQIPIREIRRIGWTLHEENALPKDEWSCDWGELIEYEYEEFVAGWRSEEDIHR